MVLPRHFPASFVCLPQLVDFWDFGPNRLESFAFLQGSPVPLAEQPSEVFYVFPRQWETSYYP